MNLLALAPTSPPPTTRRDRAAAIELSVGGVPCKTLHAVHDPIDEDRKADYDGPTGQLALDMPGESPVPTTTSTASTRWATT